MPPVRELLSPELTPTSTVGNNVLKKSFVIEVPADVALLIALLAVPSAALFTWDWANTFVETVNDKVQIKTARIFLIYMRLIIKISIIKYSMNFY